VVEVGTTRHTWKNFDAMDWIPPTMVFCGWWWYSCPHWTYANPLYRL